VQSLGLGEIKIGVGDTICRYFLIPYLKQFISLYPKIKIQVINRTSPHIIEILKSGQVDFGIVTLPVNDESVNVTLFKEVEDVFVAAPKFPELKGLTISISELVRYPLLLLQKDSATRHNLDEFFMQKGFTVTPEIELDSIELLVEFARIGLGIAHVLKESAAAFIDHSELFVVNTTETLPVRKLGIAAVKNVPLSNASSRFIEILGH
jgi:DNA-binding transcriptional LysR family regulator